MSRKPHPKRPRKYPLGKGGPAKHPVGAFTHQALGSRFAEARRLARLRGLKARNV